MNQALKLRVTLWLALMTAISAQTLLAGEDNVWIDVRTQQECDAGHLEQAALIPHTEIGDKIASVVADKDTPIKLYCRSGGRAGMAKKTLEDMGYTNVENVGGYEDARKAVGASDAGGRP